jgi:hypothetical protein
VFVGPTRLPRIPDEVDVLGPAALGSVFRAVEAGYRTICIIDGHFGNMPSVWHKEILFALAKGVMVCGSSSMGALRAAELHMFGMIGFGWIYRAFRRGVLQDDDEVCVLHAVPELNWAPLSEAMVNIRHSLKALRRRGHLSRESEARIAASLKQLHFSERDLAALRSAFELEFGAEGHAKFELYESAKVDIKALDADLMLCAIAALSGRQRTESLAFPMTTHWLNQFLFQNGDIPRLGRSRPMPQGDARSD